MTLSITSEDCSKGKPVVGCCVDTVWTTTIDEIITRRLAVGECSTDQSSKQRQNQTKGMHDENER
jgi:hypothetical protein